MNPMMASSSTAVDCSLEQLRQQCEALCKSLGTLSQEGSEDAFSEDFEQSNFNMFTGSSSYLLSITDETDVETCGEQYIYSRERILAEGRSGSYFNSQDYNNNIHCASSITENASKSSGVLPNVNHGTSPSFDFLDSGLPGKTQDNDSCASLVAESRNQRQKNDLELQEPITVSGRKESSLSDANTDIPCGSQGNTTIDQLPFEVSGKQQDYLLPFSVVNHPNPSLNVYERLPKAAVGVQPRVKSNPKSGKNCENGSTGVMKPVVKQPALSFSCPFCRKYFRSRQALESHSCCVSKRQAQGVNQQITMYKCVLCCIIYYNTVHLQKHLDSHRVYKCNLCQTLFMTRLSLDFHKLGIHGIKNSFKCRYCKKIFSEKSYLSRHVQLHEFVRNLFTKGNMRIRKIKRASRNLHSNCTKKLLGKFYCKLCNRRFRKYGHFKVHVLGHERHKCSSCDMSFSSKHLWHRHCRQVHNIRKVYKKKYPCSLCDKVFQRIGHLAIHKLIHKNEKPFPCSACKKNFRSKNALDKHMASVSHLKRICASENLKVAKKLRCECGAVFHYQETLVRHIILAHKQSKLLSCPHCEYTSKYDFNMKRHIELHKGVKKFVCELCGASFHACSALNAHNTYVHSDERSFNCDLCPKSFKAKNALNRHMHNHSNDRPFKCHCNQSYKRMSHLKRHMMSAHKMVFESKKLKNLESGKSEKVEKSVCGSDAKALISKVKSSGLSSLVSTKEAQHNHMIDNTPTSQSPSSGVSVDNSPTSHCFYTISTSASDGPVSQPLTLPMSVEVDANSDLISIPLLFQSEVFKNKAAGEPNNMVLAPFIQPSNQSMVSEASLISLSVPEMGSAACSESALDCPSTVISPAPIGEVPSHPVAHSSTSPGSAYVKNSFDIQSPSFLHPHDNPSSSYHIESYLMNELQVAVSDAEEPSLKGTDYCNAKQILDEIFSLTSPDVTFMSDKDQIVPLQKDTLWAAATDVTKPVESQESQVCDLFQDSFSSTVAPMSSTTNDSFSMQIEDYFNPFLFPADPVISSSMEVGDSMSHSYDDLTKF